MMPRLLSFVFAIAVGCGLAMQAGPTIAAEPVVVTVIGDIANPNRGPLDEFADALFSSNSMEFSKARAFTRADLAALPQHSVTANAKEWPAPVQLSGPKLSDVLAAAGASGRLLGFMALDGYQIEFEPGELAAHDWVLAIDRDGKPLDIGGRGPAWLVYNTGDKQATADEEARWIYALFAIEAR